MFVFIRTLILSLFLYSGLRNQKKKIIIKVIISPISGICQPSSALLTCKFVCAKTFEGKALNEYKMLRYKPFILLYNFIVSMILNV